MTAALKSDSPAKVGGHGSFTRSGVSNEMEIDGIKYKFPKFDEILAIV